MKVMKYVAVIALALFAFASSSNAQTLQFLGGGSSALFLELGQAAVVAEGGNGVACVWSSGALADNDISASDSRPTTADIQNGKAWVVWDKGTGADCQHPAGSFNIYTYMSVDSVIGDRCYFATDSGGVSGCTAVYTPTQTEGNTAGNLLGTGFLDSASNVSCAGANSPCIIPTTVTSFINGKRWFAAGTDVRPEDAKFASFRTLTSCTTTIFRSPFGGGLTTTSGLGYNVNGVQTGVGEPIKSFYSAPVFTIVDFNISGNDPLTNKPVPGYTVNAVGAQPIVVAVAPAGGTGLGAATDINTFTLSLFYNGVLARATDLIGPTVNPGLTTILVREPLSGTYNTFEYSVPNTNQFHTSQDLGNCNGGTGAEASNPMNLQSANGENTAVGVRRRVLGTGEMVSTLIGASASENRMGYFFWSVGNVGTGSKFTATNGKYLTVNGVDPLLNAYTDGVFPGVDAGHPIGNVTFNNFNNGDYPIWSALRIVTNNPEPAGVAALISAAQTLNSTQNDFIPLSKLKVWHSHFAIPQINVGAAALGSGIASPGDLCGTGGALPELGGDAGGANVLKQANADFCADFSNTTGLINASN